MKFYNSIIIILIFILNIVLVNNVNAENGYSLGGSVTWSVSSGNKCCVSGKNLLSRTAGKSLGKNGTESCYIPDNAAPVININYNGYVNNTWTDSDVNININVSDSESGISEVYYVINGEEITTSQNFSINLNEEGIYYIIIYAKDKANINGYNGNSTTTNKASLSITVKIDKTAPIFVIPPTNTEGWVNETSTIDFVIDDTYKGESWISKTFDCGVLPPNAIWGDFVVDGKITGACKKVSSTDCTSDSNFNPNQVYCEYSCNDGYTRGNDGLCYESSIIQTCDDSLLPADVYYYNKNEDLKYDGPSDGIITWSSPTGINLDGTFLSTYNTESNNYSPSLNQCNYSCDGGYHFENSKCVSDIKFVCCSNPELSTSTFGQGVDCNENPDDLQCTLSQLCGYDKELYSEWNPNSYQWDYTTTTDGTLSGEEGREQHCGYKLYENSNGNVCNENYYLIYVNNSSKAYTCEEVPRGRYSGEENEKHKCTNNPNNSHFVDGSDENDCDWTCDEGYESTGTKCNKISESTDCGEFGCGFDYVLNFYEDDKYCNSEIINFYEYKSNRYGTLEDCMDEEADNRYNSCKKRRNNSKYRDVTTSCRILTE